VAHREEETRRLVGEMARLARVELGPEEIAELAAEVARILEFFSVVERLDLEGCEPLAHPQDREVLLREDMARPGVGAAEALREAPARRGDAFAVPPVLPPAEGKEA
jgi:aspartyl-tRNA(Asn)/glutamyl-tRNA(Gln) amidotransferase subunit C